uniref:Ninjurin 1 n=1 Tax=Oryzias melastigma TaxID=30732 RepID=A0A3B3C0D7_ORYME
MQKQNYLLLHFFSFIRKIPHMHVKNLRCSCLPLTSDLLSQATSLRRMDYNMYATKKSAAQSMLDIALLMANSSQLKTLLYVGPQYRFYIPLIVLLALSMTLQVVVGLLLVFIGNSTQARGEKGKSSK